MTVDEARENLHIAVHCLEYSQKRYDRLRVHLDVLREEQMGYCVNKTAQAKVLCADIAHALSDMEVNYCRVEEAQQVLGHCLLMS